MRNDYDFQCWQSQISFYLHSNLHGTFFTAAISLALFVLLPNNILIQYNLDVLKWSWHSNDYHFLFENIFSLNFNRPWNATIKIKHVYDSVRTLFLIKTHYWHSHQIKIFTVRHQVGLQYNKLFCVKQANLNESYTISFCRLLNHRDFIWINKS